MVTTSIDGAPVNGASFHPKISASGRYVVYSSYAENLVPVDGNRFADVFLHDRVTGTTELVSTSITGAAGNENSVSPEISADGRYVAFWSFANNLVENDTNRVGDIFVRDVLADRTTRVSLSTTGDEANSGSHRLAMSGDGRYVAFSSWASNLVPGDANETGDVFLRDRVTGVTILASVSTAGAQATTDNAMNPIDLSADGRHVTFASEDTGLVIRDSNDAEDVFVRDLDVRSASCR